MLKTVFIKCTLIAIWWGSTLVPLWAQEGGAPIKLVDCLLQLEERFGSTFSYNHTVLNGVFLSGLGNCASLSACLDVIEGEVPVTFEKSGEGNFMVLPVREDVQFEVVDKETGEQVISLSIQINDMPEVYLFPRKSRYTLKNIFPLDSVHIHSSFYKSIHMLVSDLLSLKKPLGLENQSILLSEVLIARYLTEGVDAKLSDHSLQVDMKSLGLLAGETDGDLFGVLKNIPGIRTPSGKPGSLNFRGGTFDQTFIHIDDIPIYHTGHFFGAISPYNPSVVDHIEIQRNTLPAKWGGRVGGLINMTTGNSVPDSATYGITANTLYAGASIKVPLIRSKLGVSIAGRFSYPGFRSPKLAAFSVLNFQGSRLETVAEEVNGSSVDFKAGFDDINSKVIYDINKYHKATISFINIQNRLSAELRDRGDEQADFRDLNLDNSGLTVKWEGQFSNKLNGEIRFSKSSLTISNISEGFLADQRMDFEKYLNVIEDIRLISEASFEFTPNVTLEGGYTYTDHAIRFDERIEEGNVDTQNRQDGLVHSLFFSARKNWKDILIANIGVHSDYYEPNTTLYADPRVSVSFMPSDALLFKFSAGRSHQFIQKKLPHDFDDFNLKNQFWFLPGPTTFVLRGYQAMVGALYNRSGLLVDLELYFRDTNNISSQPLDDEGKEGYMKSLGADLFMKKRWGKLETWLGYSLGKVETEFEERAPAFFDQRHALNVTGSLHLKKWNFVLSWGYFSGMPVITPVFDSGGGSGPVIQTPYSRRFPNQHQLDISSTYTFHNKKESWRGVIGVSFVNLYDQDNIVNLFQNVPNIDNPYRKTIGFAPNLQLSLHF